ncbi:hypothetical protein CMV_018525 [Castanea mollissima]|uniref:Uncharacterized protein n=1 Tax=Castanea mollissima TaxID=60419 RepID=A0A8J4VG40_9ROSI|nr:hypothetical protein CMV_018525 [Castanea mollissima]
MNLSASRLGLTNILLLDELFPSLNDPDTVNGADYVAIGVQSGKELRPLLASPAEESAPPSSDTSAMADLTDSTISHPNAPPRIQKLGIHLDLKEKGRQRKGNKIRINLLRI